MDNKERIVELVRRAKARDSHAFTELYKMVYTDLYKMALYNLDNPEDAENAVSDTVLDAYAGIDRLRDESAFKSWIFRILSNKCNRLKREYVRRRQNEYGQPIESVAEVLPGKGNVFEKVEDGMVVQQALGVLSEEEKNIVTLTVFADMDSAEVAQSLNMNRNTVRSKYMRALSKMRVHLRQGGEGYVR